MQRNRENRRYNHQNNRGERSNQNNNNNDSTETPPKRVRDKPFMIGYNHLKELVANHANNPNLLLLNLSKQTSFLKLIIDDNRLKGRFGDYEFLCLIIESYAIICDSDADILLPFIARIGDTNFHQPIQNYLMRFQTLVNPVIAKNPKLHVDAFCNLVKFVRQMQQMIPQSSRDKLKLILLSLNDAMEICNKKDDVIVKSTIDLLRQVRSENEIALNKGGLDDEKAAKAEKMHAILQPPNNFREISICPTYEDIHVNGTPFLRSNLIKGKYFDVDHYLDVQFRLLREDYVRPLREGIASYLSAIKDNKKVTRLKDIRVYTNVRILSSQLKDGLIFEARFDVSLLSNVRWQMSNRLLHGSLLCLSYDNFQTFCFATVTGPRLVDKLAKGFVSIKFETHSLDEQFNKINPLVSLTMVESQAYFEAYRHNLQALQTFNSENFPLQDYIISVSSVIQNLPYLQQTTAYDLTDLAYPLIKISSDEFTAIKDTHNALNTDDKVTLFDTFKSTLDIDHNKLKQLETVPVLVNSSWPDINILGFDDSQYQAFRAALIKQLVIIQGPPGTGKTYISLRIVQTLLRNSRHWNGERNINENGIIEQILFQPNNHKPILIVCFTNHALDQFLEGMVPFCNENHGIVRIGGRSKSELLQSYTLLELKRKVKQSRVIPETLYYGLINSRRELELIQRNLSKLQGNLEQFIKRLLNESEITELCDQYEWIQRFVNQLANLYGFDINLALINWLRERSSGVAVDIVQDLVVGGEDIDEEVDMDEEQMQQILDTRIIDEDNDYEGETHTHVNVNNINEEETTAKYEDTSDGFTLKLSKKEREKFVKLMEEQLKSNDMMNDEEIARIRIISHLSHDDRWRLYRRWVNVCSEDTQKEIEKRHHEYCIEMRKYNRLKIEEDLCVIRGCDVIGMTTTGAAKYRSIIEQIDPSVVVIEEAAEVLESHVITSLAKSTNHLILIGDHQQLKPNPNVYELAKKFKLDVSLFERMINNGMPYYQLKLQHRMRPCISSLLVPHFYKELRDHHSVKAYENIKGVWKNMFFLNHSEIESYFTDSQSKFNNFEANFVVYLCKYLVQQQYKPSQITIIVMYSAQLFRVRNFMKEHQSLLSGVRVTAIDNYQGEENDIIILSFVRSNIEGSIGFLQVSNRVNVALSRAKMGLYGVGNFDCLANQSQLWKDITKDLEDAQAIGPHLELYCQNHPTRTALVSKASDFSEVPEGGCNKPCDTRLNCGHVCPIACHVYDREHETVKCTKVCSVPYNACEHRCEAMCHYGKSCEPCKERVRKLIPDCGHLRMMFCSDDPTKVKCFDKCERVLSCGHKCTNLCGFVCNPLTCKEMVRYLSQCGHIVNIQCCQRNNTEKLLSICNEDCSAVLKCGDKCSGSCGQCQQNRLHAKCRMKCGRNLVCGHFCKAVCGDNCPPCQEKCQNRCLHSQCKRKCGEPCPPCLERCKWQCVHKQCTRNCSEKCDRQLCEEPCALVLKCGHNCIGICGEPCPDKCRICNKEEVEDILFGYEEEPNSRFIQLQDCKHVLELKGMIYWLSMSEDKDANAERNSNLVIQMKRCPKCKTIIRRTKLFNSSIQDAIRDIELVKVRLFDKFQENEETRKTIIKDMEIFFDKDIKAIDSENKLMLRNKAQNLFDITQSKQRKSKLELNIIQTKFDAIKQLTKISELLWKYKFQRKYNKDLLDINIIIGYTYQRIEKFLKYIDTLVNNEQQISDLQNEMKFIHFSSEIIRVSSDRVFSNEDAKRNLVSVFELLQCLGPFGEAKRNEVKELIEKAVKLQGGLGVSLEEKIMIVKAMGFRQGHWYKCPNGHVYCIADCGGANQAGVCPECKSAIGGVNHRLASGNALATEMDGSTRPAYDPNADIDWQQWIND